MRIEQPLSAFKIKMIIGMVLESKHKNFKRPIKNEKAAKKYNMFIPRAFEKKMFSQF
jgi:hypothetical protein